MELRDMAEAHLKNVQQQIQELQQNRDRIDVDIKALSDYLQQGVLQLNAPSQASLDFQPPLEGGRSEEGEVQIPTLALPPGSKP